MPNQDTPLHRLDEREHWAELLAELDAAWVDEFCALCDTDARDSAGLAAHSRQCDTIEAMMETVKGMLP
ncbi:MAG: hypothetical protein M0Z43_13505 [Acidithiobacillus sp.]|nr:hypothetical protein [Acidithiobacillus sp.]